MIKPIRRVCSPCLARWLSWCGLGPSRPLQAAILHICRNTQNYPASMSKSLKVLWCILCISVFHSFHFHSAMTNPTDQSMQHAFRATCHVPRWWLPGRSGPTRKRPKSWPHMRRTPRSWSERKSAGDFGHFLSHFLSFLVISFKIFLWFYLMFSGHFLFFW